MQDIGRKRSSDCKQLLNINKPGKALLNITKAYTGLICRYFLRRFLTEESDESSYSISITTLVGGREGQESVQHAENHFCLLTELWGAEPPAEP